MNKIDIKQNLLLKGYTLVDNNLPENILTNEKITFYDSEGYYYYSKYNNIQSGNRPLKYNSSNIYTLRNMQNYISKYSNSILLSNKWEGYKKKYTLQCGICGVHFKRPWGDICAKKRFYCHKCTQEKSSRKYSLDYVDNQLKQYGYTRLSKYIGNNDKMLCVDKDGYKVYVKLTQLGKMKPYRFSTKFNEKNYIDNVNHYIKLNNYDCKVLSYTIDNKCDYPDLQCLCGCGNIYITKLSYLKDNQGIYCPSCYSKTSSYEHKVEQWLKSKHIEYIMQYKFEDCIVVKKLPFDFYLPAYNCCIEVDGIQHYEKIRGMSDEDLEKRQYYDKIKTEYCKNNNIKLIRIKYTDIDKRCEDYKTILYNELIKK